ncbi:MAG: hypothetical protein COA79_25060 [Planctomycetota bacterium]|nr:MAG: hypothetical protein COA79_25060 [Planctomycetota bacterium]
MDDTEKKPNFLFLMTDQLRYDFVGYLGADHVNTPNIDSIANKGHVFTHCLACPICVPSRLSLATGIHPLRTGEKIDNEMVLKDNDITYYQRLRDFNYRVGCSGKLDLHKKDDYNGRNGDRPLAYKFGFTHPIEIEGKMHAGNKKTPSGPYGFWLEEKGKYEEFHNDYMVRRKGGWRIGQTHDSVLSNELFADTYIGQRAVEWLRELPDDFPWHMFVSFAGPHDPYDPPKKFADKYRNTKMPDAIESDLDEKPEWVSKRIEKGDVKEIEQLRQQYCASLEAIDVQVGEILQALEERGERENTYIIFSSDHGDMLGDHKLYHKSCQYEGATRVPLVVSGPNIQPGKSNTLVELHDLNPTICELAGLEPQIGIDAKSLVPYLNGDVNEHRSESVNALYNFKSIRNKKHKYVNSPCGFEEIYDLEKDVDEKNNIAKENPELCSSLNQKIIEFENSGKELVEQ